MSAGLATPRLAIIPATFPAVRGDFNEHIRYTILIRSRDSINYRHMIRILRSSWLGNWILSDSELRAV